MQNENLCTIYIVRHGQSEGNLLIETPNFAWKDFGEFGSDLTTVGRLQAKELGKSLKNIHFDAVFSSDLLRAKRTADIIFQERKLEIITTQVLRERYWGSRKKDFGKIKREIGELQEGLSDLEKMKVTVGDVESEYTAGERLITFLRETAGAFTGKTVLVVCHGNIMRILLVKLGWCKYNELGVGAIENTGYIKLQTDGVDFFIKETHRITKKN